MSPAPGSAAAAAAEQLGRGWSFPVRWSRDAEGRGAVELVEGEADVRQAILVLLRTGVDERVMRPRFGAGVERYVFAPASGQTMFGLQEDVRRALLLGEPRIIVDRVEALEGSDGDGRIDVHIDYRLEPHRRPQSIVFPFYIQPQEVAVQPQEVAA